MILNMTTAIAQPIAKSIDVYTRGVIVEYSVVAMHSPPFIVIVGRQNAAEK